MSEEKFVETLLKYQNFLDVSDRLMDLGIDLTEGPVTMAIDTLLDSWIDAITGEAGSDLIYWWLFEDVEKKIYEDDKVVATLDTAENLYNYMKENNYFHD
jgi:hypothetical protein